MVYGGSDKMRNFTFQMTIYDSTGFLSSFQNSKYELKIQWVRTVPKNWYVNCFVSLKIDLSYSDKQGHRIDDMKDLLIILGFMMWISGFIFAIYCFYSALLSD